jgi:hypothetical protein
MEADAPDDWDSFDEQAKTTKAPSPFDVMDDEEGQRMPPWGRPGTTRNVRAASPSLEMRAAFPPAPMKPLVSWPEGAPVASSPRLEIVPIPPAELAPLPKEILELVPATSGALVVLAPTRAPRAATQIHRRLSRRWKYAALFAAVVVVSALITTQLARKVDKKPEGSTVTTTMVITAPPAPVIIPAPPPLAPAASAEYLVGAAALGAIEGTAPPVSTETSPRHRKAVHAAPQVKWDPDSPFLPTEAKK